MCAGVEVAGGDSVGVAVAAGVEESVAAEKGEVVVVVSTLETAWNLDGTLVSAWRVLVDTGCPVVSETGAEEQPNAKDAVRIAKPSRRGNVSHVPRIGAGILAGGLTGVGNGQASALTVRRPVWRHILMMADIARLISPSRGVLHSRVGQGRRQGLWRRSSSYSWRTRVSAAALAGYNTISKGIPNE